MAVSRLEIDVERKIMRQLVARDELQPRVLVGGACSDRMLPNEQRQREEPTAAHRAWGSRQAEPAELKPECLNCGMRMVV